MFYDNIFFFIFYRVIFFLFVLLLWYFNKNDDNSLNVLFFFNLINDFVLYINLWLEFSNINKIIRWYIIFYIRLEVSDSEIES